jgi:hypothetical protein
MNILLSVNPNGSFNMSRDDGLGSPSFKVKAKDVAKAFAKLVPEYDNDTQAIYVRNILANGNRIQQEAQ